ncbi:MAG: DUF3016 domain-containing protein [Verrucomicrobia bacterium]|nr:DUF3016 domain-containing protein [Verrucomicrobiota bacterium]
MNIQHALFPIAVLSCILASTPVVSAQSATVDVQYVQPAKFTDFSIYGRGAQWSASYFATQISDDLRPALQRKVSGGRLTLRFTDIDLAGHYPSRGGSSARVVRGQIRPARMSFAFVLQDSSGRTLASGSTRIVDNSSTSSLANPRRSQALYYEKRMLERWLRSLKTS